MVRALRWAVPKASLIFLARIVDSSGVGLETCPACQPLPQEGHGHLSEDSTVSQQETASVFALHSDLDCLMD